MYVSESSPIRKQDEHAINSVMRRVVKSTMLGAARFTKFPGLPGSKTFEDWRRCRFGLTGLSKIRVDCMGCQKKTRTYINALAAFLREGSAHVLLIRQYHDAGCLRLHITRLPPGLDDLPDDGFYSALQKKSLDIPVPQAEHVCPVTILKRHRPDFGHMGNGSYVEVQQDSERSFEATFVECTEGHHRPPCHGIDTLLYSSECVTLYEWRSAYVRLPGSNVNFTPAKVKIPIACQCRLTRKLQLFPRRLFNLMS
ncbi:unnamed protein product [Heligmosomoides polygyrus]|uniref:NGF domain-containing protein n=1 Tax=Heligmosomoides polygyrus TaxID=6339 RepID=A0A3P8D425_HELPZ|nr:unnamed protein product [Heligmosomoides polygyrus]